MPDFSDTQALLDLRNLAVALAVGFLIGFEREHTHAAENKQRTFAGARTFALVALSGGLTGLFGESYLLAAVALLMIGALTVAAYWAAARGGEDGFGGTTEVAIAVAFLLGFSATRGSLLVAAAGGVAAAIILSIKPSVEKLADSLSSEELYAALRLLAISIIILPVLPNEGFGPYEALNPREIWLMVVFISGLSFVGYWLIKIVGQDKGFLLTGLAGGLASSTATTLSLSRFAKEGANPGQVAAGVIAANVVMVIRVGFLLAAVARDVLAVVTPALVAAALTGAAAALWVWRRENKKDANGKTLELGNPMEIVPALIFAALLAVITLASRFGIDQLGESGLLLVAFISGLADVDAMTLTAGRQAGVGDITATIAASAVLAAVFSNIVVKAGMAWSIGGAAAGRTVAMGFAAMVAAGGGVFLLT
ncbi:MgtC/SapB family protein [Hyphococcus sp.]|uniref:MgtC/SapB family protein n=1 Tax=Hyphococcus sp. TaxID=2038636 RepID=UPI003CCC3642